MKNPFQRLQGKLDQTLSLLGQRSFFSFTSEETQSLRGRVQELSQKVASIESSFLTIGLLGGTGVGKSTLMNALADSEISSTSHRRPYTDEVLVYRHAASDPLVPLASKDVPCREITHQADSIQQILLCDLPDFDSLVGEHRESVICFLEHLDILVWVTSPEKYADRRFYEFLQLVPKAGQNFYFVLNKADLLFEGGSLEMGYEQLARVTVSFQDNIRHHGIDRPLIYAISAEEALSSDQLSPWNQCQAFREQIFQQQDIKKITAVKAANLDVEVQQLLAAFQKEMLNLELFERILESSAKELEKERSVWIQAGRQAIDLWLGKDIRQDILSCLADASVLVGPAYGLAIVYQEWQKRLTEEKNSPSNASPFILPEGIALSFRRRLQLLEERLAHRILDQNLPSSFQQRLKRTMNMARTLEDLRERFSRLVALRLAEPSLAGFPGFRTLQLIIYALVFAFFLFAIGGETAWREVLKNPGGASIVGLLLSGVNTLFSVKGLAAMGSYALLNLFFAFRFYRRHRRLLRHEAQKIMDSLKVELGKVWEEKIDSIAGNLSDFRAEIRDQISSICALKERKGA